MVARRRLSSSPRSPQRSCSDPAPSARRPAAMHSMPKSLWPSRRRPRCPLPTRGSADGHGARARVGGCDDGVSARSRCGDDFRCPPAAPGLHRRPSRRSSLTDRCRRSRTERADHRIGVSRAVRHDRRQLASTRHDIDMPCQTCWRRIRAATTPEPSTRVRRCCPARRTAMPSMSCSMARSTRCCKHVQHGQGSPATHTSRCCTTPRPRTVGSIVDGDRSDEAHVLRIRLPVCGLGVSGASRPASGPALACRA